MSKGNDLDSAWLVFGLTGSIGRALKAHRAAGDPGLLALSRRPQPDEPGLSWMRGDLADFADPERPVCAVASLGPLDAFVDWFARSRLAPARVVAISSTSVHGKAGSPDPAERALAARLRDAEARLRDLAASRGCALTVLRPTLIYGLAGDFSLSRLVAIARRWRCLPLPHGARGLRMPVHADDLAQAVRHCLRSVQPIPGSFDLGGGEVLPYDEMVARCLAAGAPGARLLRLPDGLFRTGVRLARASGRLGGAGEGVLARLGQDLVFDQAPARQALGYQPRPFRPDADTFRS